MNASLLDELTRRIFNPPPNARRCHECNRAVSTDMLLCVLTCGHVMHSKCLADLYERDATALCLRCGASLSDFWAYNPHGVGEVFTPWNHPRLVLACDDGPDSDDDEEVIDLGRYDMPTPDDLPDTIIPSTFFNEHAYNPWKEPAALPPAPKRAQPEPPLQTHTGAGGLTAPMYDGHFKMNWVPHEDSRNSTARAISPLPHALGPDPAVLPDDLIELLKLEREQFARCLQFLRRNPTLDRRKLRDAPHVVELRAIHCLMTDTRRAYGLDSRGGIKKI
jgi:hypothetical protein